MDLAYILCSGFGSFQNNYSPKSNRRTQIDTPKGRAGHLVTHYLHCISIISLEPENVMGDIHISQLYFHLATQVNSHAFTTAIIATIWLLF